MNMANASIESVTSRFETATGLKGDRADQLYREAMKDADKLQPMDQQRVITSLVEKGILPNVSIAMGQFKDGKGGPIDMHEKSNYGHPRNFMERVAKEMSTSTDYVNRARDILDKNRDKDYPEKMATAAEVANAQRHFKSLQDKAGPDAKEGLSKENLKVLLERGDLTAAERKAAKFLLEKHDQLGETWQGLQLGTKRIKPDGLLKYAKSELGVDGEKVEDARRNGIKQEVIKDSQMNIESGDSYWTLAKKNLPKDASNQQIFLEMQRLQKLNNNKPLYTNQKISTRNNDEIDKEVQRRRAA
jgi:hypothetical protein